MSKILVVDDNEAAADQTKAYLEIIGKHEVRIAYSPTAARLLLADAKYDVLIFDYRMGETGIDLLRWSRKRGIATPCIILSAIDPEKLHEIESSAVAEKLSPVVALPKIVEPLSLLLDTILLLTK